MNFTELLLSQQGAHTGSNNGFKRKACQTQPTFERILISAPSLCLRASQPQVATRSLAHALWEAAHPTDTLLPPSPYLPESQMLRPELSHNWLTPSTAGKYFINKADSSISSLTVGSRGGGNLTKTKCDPDLQGRSGVLLVVEIIWVVLGKTWSSFTSFLASKSLCPFRLV